MLIFFQFPSFVFKENHIIEENNPSEKNVTDELDGIDIDDIGNLEDFLGIVFVHEECWNLKVFVGSGKLTRHINEKKKPGVLLIDVHSVTNVFCESISAVTTWNIVNQ